MCTCKPPHQYLSKIFPWQSRPTIHSWNSRTENSGDSDLRCKDLLPAPAVWDLAEDSQILSLQVTAWLQPVAAHGAPCRVQGWWRVCVCVQGCSRIVLLLSLQHVTTTKLKGQQTTGNVLFRNKLPQTAFIYFLYIFRSYSEMLPWQTFSKESLKTSMNQ